MTLIELIAQISVLIENVNSNIESMGEVINTLNDNGKSVDVDDRWDHEEWRISRGGWRSGSGWSTPIPR